MYAPPLGETARARLQIMRETEDGFRIAEEDLKIRGAGDLLGTAQSGLPKLRVADFARDTALIRELGLNVQYVLDTHVHADHVTGPIHHGATTHRR